MVWHAKRTWSTFTTISWSKLDSWNIDQSGAPTTFHYAMSLREVLAARCPCSCYHFNALDIYILKRQIFMIAPSLAWTWRCMDLATQPILWLNTGRCQYKRWSHFHFSHPLLPISGLRALWLCGLRLMQWLWSHSRGGTGLAQIPIYLGEAPF